MSARSSVDRAPDYGSGCRRFKSSRALQFFMSSRVDEVFMLEALKEAQKAFDEDETPVGAIVVKDGDILARAHNQREQLIDPTAHAELIAVKAAAAKLSSWRLLDTTVYVTLEPCPMCAGALVLARVKRLVFGAFDPKAGAVGTLMNLLDDARLNHQVEVLGGVLEEESKSLLRNFFLLKRKKLSGEMREFG